MYCTSCGVRIIDDSQFCGNCGKPVRSSEPPIDRPPLASTSQVTITKINDQDRDKLLVLIAHIGSCFFSFFAPLVVYIIRRDADEKQRWAKDNAISSLNFQLTVVLLFVVILTLQAVIYNRASNWTLPMFLDGTMESLNKWSEILGLVLLVAVILDYILCIVAAVKSTGGRVFLYPLSIRFITQRRGSGINKADSIVIAKSGGLTTATVQSPENVAPEDQQSKLTGEPTLGRQISKRAKFVLALLGALSVGAVLILFRGEDPYKEPKLTETVIRSPNTKLETTLGSMRGQLNVFHNGDSLLAWVALNSEVIFSTESDLGLSADQIKSPDNRAGDYSRQFYRFSNSAGNICEGPHFVVEITKKDYTVHKIDTCDNWDHVANHLSFSDGKVLYKKMPKDGQ